MKSNNLLANRIKEVGETGENETNLASYPETVPQVIKSPRSRKGRRIDREPADSDWFPRGRITGVPDRCNCRILLLYRSGVGVYRKRGRWRRDKHTTLSDNNQAGGR